MLQFVPIVDDLPTDLGSVASTLVAYRPGLTCWHGMAGNPADAPSDPAQQIEAGESTKIEH